MKTCLWENRRLFYEFAGDYVTLDRLLIKTTPCMGLAHAKLSEVRRLRTVFLKRKEI